MMKNETRKALLKLVLIVVERSCSCDRRDPDDVEDAAYVIYDKAEKFVKAFRKNELKIDDD